MNRQPDAWKRLGELIRDHRTRRDWTQQELARQAGVSTKSVVTAESGKPPTRMPPTLDRIGRALDWQTGGVDIALSGGDPSTPPPPTPLPLNNPGRAVAALRKAVEFSQICAEMGADPAALAQFDAAAEELLTSTLIAQDDRYAPKQERFAAVAHSPSGDGGPESDRAIVDEAVRQFVDERAQGQ
jgi:DNA-binding XRE family transcriptional regulator